MASPSAPILHTGSGSPTAQGLPTGVDRSLGRPLSSVVEHAVHIGGVASSKLAAATNPSTTWRGDLCEAIAAAEFVRLGYGVSRPVTNGLPYDLIVDDGSRLHRIQVKSGAMTRGTLIGRMSAAKYHRGRRKPVGYAGRVDWIVVVWAEAGKCYIVRPDATTGTLSLRVEPSLNNQSQGVRWAADYELAVALGPAHAYASLKPRAA